MTLQDFIDEALCSTTRTKEYELKITPKASEIIKKHTRLNICKYKFIIKEEYVRHIRNGHEKDLDLLHKLPEILNDFSHVEKSITRNKQTGQTDVSLVFRKKFDEDITKMVALRIIKGQILSLRTFYRP